MVWTTLKCPQSFDLLSPRIREKAISIGNALIQNNIPPAHAERIAYERAVDWARRGERSSQPYLEHHVKPFYGQWAVFYRGCEEPEYRFPTQEAAIQQALGMARRKRAEIVIYGTDGRVIERNSFA